MRSLSKPEAVLAALLIAALWLALYPLVGVRQDAVLYLGQALARLQPTAYANDLFLSLSGQDRFTIATGVTSRLFVGVGIGMANTAVLLLTQLLSAGLLFCLIRPWVGARMACAGLLLYACASNGYGPEQAFGFAEPYITARNLAEPFVWGALLAWQRGRVAAALALLVAASLMHPLIALPGWAVAGCSLLRKHPRWAVAPLLLATIVAGCVVLGWPAALAPFDAQWLAVIQQRNVVFLRQMDLMDWCKAVFPAITLWLVMRRQLAEAALTPRRVLEAAVLLTGAAAVFADLLQSTLLTQLQLWRGLWPMQALGLVCLPWLIWQQVHQPSPLRWSLGLAAAAAFTAVNASAPSAPWLIAWWLLLQAIPGDKVTRGAARAASFASAALLLSAIVASVQVMALRAPRVAPFALHQEWFAWLATPVIPVALFGIVWFITTRKVWAGLFIGVTAFTASAAIWDQRTPVMRAIDAIHPPSTHPWQALIPEQTGVLWPGHVEVVWALLARPVFHDHDLGAAVVFSRELAMRYAVMEKNFEAMRKAEVQCQLQHLLLMQPGQPKCATPVDALGALCLQLPELRFFVGAQRWAPAWVSTWRPPGAASDHAGFHLHDCQRLRATAVTTSQSAS